MIDSAQDWRDEDLPGDTDGDPRNRLGCPKAFPSRLCWDASCLLDHVPLLVVTPVSVLLKFTFMEIFKIEIAVDFPFVFAETMYLCWLCLL